jgi:hypothetical protein
LDGHREGRRRIESRVGRTIQCRSAGGCEAWWMMEAGRAAACLRGRSDGDAATVAPGRLERRHGVKARVADAGAAVDAQGDAADFTPWWKERVEQPAKRSWGHGGGAGALTVRVRMGRGNPRRCLGEGEVRI